MKRMQATGVAGTAIIRAEITAPLACPVILMGQITVMGATIINLTLRNITGRTLTPVTGRILTQAAGTAACLSAGCGVAIFVATTVTSRPAQSVSFLPVTRIKGR